LPARFKILGEDLEYFFAPKSKNGFVVLFSKKYRIKIFFRYKLMFTIRGKYFAFMYNLVIFDFL